MNSSMEVELAIDGKQEFDHVYSLAHLGKACAGIPGIPAKVCAEFEKTNITDHEFTTCIDLTLEVLHHHVGHPAQIGCIHFRI